MSSITNETTCDTFIVVSESFWKEDAEDSYEKGIRGAILLSATSMEKAQFIAAMHKAVDDLSKKLGVEPCVG